MKSTTITHKYNEKKLFYFFKDVLFPQDTRNDTHLFTHLFFEESLLMILERKDFVYKCRYKYIKKVTALTLYGYII